MKAEKAHRIPLASQVQKILESLPRKNGSNFVFIGKAGEPLSNNAMLKLLKRMGRGDITVHGFRSSFTDWCSERTNFSEQTREHALAHGINDKTMAAYKRGTEFEKRRRLMQAWADYCSTPRSTAEVTPIRAAG
jgi:integrase